MFIHPNFQISDKKFLTQHDLQFELFNYGPVPLLPVAVVHKKYPQFHTYHEVKPLFTVVGKGFVPDRPPFKHEQDRDAVPQLCCVVVKTTGGCVWDVSWRKGGT